MKDILDAVRLSSQYVPVDSDQICYVYIDFEGTLLKQRSVSKHNSVDRCLSRLADLSVGMCDSFLRCPSSFKPLFIIKFVKH